MPAFLLPQDPESVGRGEGAPRPRAPRCSLSRDGWTLEGQRRADWLWPEEAPSQLTRYKTKCEEETSTPPNPAIPKSHHPQRSRVLFPLPLPTCEKVEEQLPVQFYTTY